MRSREKLIYYLVINSTAKQSVDSASILGGVTSNIGSKPWSLNDNSLGLSHITAFISRRIHVSSLGFSIFMCCLVFIEDLIYSKRCQM